MLLGKFVKPTRAVSYDSWQKMGCNGFDLGQFFLLHCLQWTFVFFFSFWKDIYSVLTKSTLLLFQKLLKLALCDISIAFFVVPLNRIIRRLLQPYPETVHAHKEQPDWQTDKERQTDTRKDRETGRQTQRNTDTNTHSCEIRTYYWDSTFDV